MRIEPDPDPTLPDRIAHRPVAARPISVAELFTIGIGPSSSHTVGPMRAAFDFAQRALGQGAEPIGITCDLYGSLALTGRGSAPGRRRRPPRQGMAATCPISVPHSASSMPIGRVRWAATPPWLGPEPGPGWKEVAAFRKDVSCAARARQSIVTRMDRDP